ncbi:MAG: MFS transporter [Dermabacter sp.]|nr:MFS transporter [Dermabacter sp.]
MSLIDNRQFIALWSAGTIVFAAGTLVSFLLPVIAVDQWEGAPYGPALVSLALGLPWLLLGMLAGIMADRVNARTILVCASGGTSLVLAAASIGIAHSLAPTGAILVTTGFLVGCGTVVRATASQAALPKLVAKDERVQANSWQLRSTSAIELLALLVGGALATLSAPAGLMAAAVLSLLAIPFSLAVNAPPAGARTKPKLLEGFRFLLTTPEVRQSTIVTALWRCSAGVGSALALPYLVDGMGVRGVGLGLAMGAIGIGVFAGSLALPTLNGKFKNSADLWRAMLVLGAVGSVVRAIPLGPVSVFAFVLGGLMIGFAITTTNILVITQRMNLTPREHLGQVAAAFSMIVWGAMPLGAALGVPLLAVFEPASAFLIGSLLLIACPIAAALPPLGQRRTLDAAT